MGQTAAVRRDRAAMHRVALSMPARTALLDGLLPAGRRALDYGCGRGGDVTRLRQLGLDVRGWDPAHAPDSPPEPASAVLCTYVVNSIEDTAERARVLRHAWELTEGVLVLAARTPQDARRLRGDTLNDGVLTSRRTFQRPFPTAELLRWIEEELSVKPLAAAPGVAYVFRGDRERVDYLARRYAGAGERPAIAEAGDALHRLVHWLHHRGRQPTVEEDPETVALAHRAFGSLARAQAAAAAAADPVRVAAQQQRRRVDLLVLLALAAFHGDRSPSQLPEAFRADSRALYPSFREACRRADWLLWAIGQPDQIRRAVRASRVGKVTPTALYVHARAERLLPGPLRVYALCAEAVTGRPETTNVLKLHHTEPKVSLLSYPDFDRDPHPQLAESLTIDLRQQRVEWQDWTTRRNRPLLHRKEEFLDPADERWKLYHKLTRQEIAAGMYADPSRIGLTDGWQAVLQDSGHRILGHRLVRGRSVPPPATRQ